jgi:hypothetical protein
MPRGAKGEKRPADVNARAVMIARIATGELEGNVTDDGKNKAAHALGAWAGRWSTAPLTFPRNRSVSSIGSRGWHAANPRH